MTTLLKTEHDFAQYVRTLGKGKKGSRSLSQQEAYDAFTSILKGEVEDLQLGAFLMLLRVKEESPEEVAGFVQACKNHIAAPQNIHADIDWSSYAGKRKHLPWFIGCLLILAQNGHRIFIHGAKGHTQGRLYTENAFRELGLPVAINWQQAKEQLDTHNLSYLSVEHFCTPLHEMLNMRNLLGLRSPVHTLSRLINPLNAEYSFQSIFHPAYADTHQQASLLLKQPNMAVLKGESGEIERKADATCLVKSISGGVLTEEKWPRLLDGKHEGAETLDLSHFKAVWQGAAHDEYGEQAIIGTLAIILKLIEKQKDFEAAFARASELWLNRNKNCL